MLLMLLLVLNNEFNQKIFLEHLSGTRHSLETGCITEEKIESPCPCLAWNLEWQIDINNISK